MAMWVPGPNCVTEITMEVAYNWLDHLRPRKLVMLCHLITWAQTSHTPTPIWLIWSYYTTKSIKNPRRRSRTNKQRDRKLKLWYDLQSTLFLNIISIEIHTASFLSWFSCWKFLFVNELLSISRSGGYRNKSNDSQSHVSYIKSLFSHNLLNNYPAALW